MNGLSQCKIDDPLFVDILLKYDICFLFETWTNSSSNISLNGYISHNFYRKFQNKNARRCSGGVALYFKEYLKDGIEII